MKLQSVSRFYKKQTNQIRKGGWPVLLRKHRTLLRVISRRSGSWLLFILFVAPALLLVITVRIIRPFIHIRLGMINGARIGHFAAETELYLCKRDKGLEGEQTFDVFYYYLPICNQQLKKMFERIPNWVYILKMPNFAAVLDKVNRYFPGNKKHMIPRSARDTYNLLENTLPHLSFTEEEEEMGIAGKRKLGIPADAQFICFYARDPLYLESLWGPGGGSYHNYRNCEISSYLPAAEELTKRGYYLVRMGHIVRDPLKTNNPMIVDYATKGRTDFLDIYLLAKCRFFISSGAGIDEITEIFRRPIVFVNYIPLMDVNSWSPQQLTIPKKLWLKEAKRFLSFKEILCSPIGEYSSSEQYNRQGIDIVDNTSEEIMEACLEMEERLNGTWKSQDGDDELQRRFWAFMNGSKKHGEIRARIGAKFLRENKELWE